eukprot:m.230338 g.230338  ORF g.230338 m.230338 type:complete len:451 (+) comp12047_c0_seq1:791-2143(+)
MDRAALQIRRRTACSRCSGRAAARAVCRNLALGSPGQSACVRGGARLLLWRREPCDRRGLRGRLVLAARARGRVRPSGIVRASLGRRVGATPSPANGCADHNHLAKPNTPSLSRPVGIRAASLSPCRGRHGNPRPAMAASVHRDRSASSERRESLRSRNRVTSNYFTKSNLSMKTSERLVNLDRTIDLADKNKRAVEADRARRKEDAEGHEQRVAEVEERRDGIVDAELGGIVEHAVEKHVDGAGAAQEEGAPPPVVVLSAELKVDKHDRDLCAGDDEHERDEEEKSEEIVELVFPDCAENKEQLDEDGAKRQDAGDRDRDWRLEVCLLRGHLARDLVDLEGGIIRALAVAEVEAANDKRQRDADPHEQQREHCRKGHRPGRVLAPDKEVEEEAGAKDCGREEDGKLDRSALPRLAVEGAVQAAGKVARDEAHEHEDKDSGSHESPTAGG